VCLDKLRTEILPPFLSYVRAARARNLSGLSERELLEELDVRIERVMTKFGKESLKPTFFAALTYGLVENNLCAVLGEREGKAVARQVMMGLEGDKTLEASIALYEVAQGDRRLDSFLEEYGHRAVNELELAQPRWREDTGYLERMMANYRAPGSRSPAWLHQQQREQREAVEAKLPEILSSEGGASLVDEVQQDLKRAQEFMPWRETSKHYLMMGYELIREVLEELGWRWEVGSDINFLHCDELSSFGERANTLKEQIAQRKVRWQALQRLTFPEVIRSDELERLDQPVEIQGEGRELEGVALAAGAATGTAQLLRSPDEARDMEDYIIVCPSTDPGWMPLFVRARGLVVERGGMLSHGAVVARDFGIPAVRITAALQRIPDGAPLRVDGNAGKVYLL
jgi:pyruvate,water dikinase